MNSEVAAVLDLSLARLVKLEERIAGAEGDGLRARWEFGRDLLAERVGKKLPPGRLGDVSAETGASRREIQTRMQFAEHFADETALRDAIAQWRSWFRIVHEALPERSREEPAEPGILVPLPEGVFRVIVADPPWRYGNTATRGAAEDHYATMTIEELCDLDVEDRSADDAHLYLWTTNGFLREAFDVMEAWGFAYKTTLTWVKTQIGLGNYFRNNTEHVLFGVRGALRTKVKDIPTAFEAPRGKHSTKPDLFYDLVERASTGPYLEMFARRRRLGDWTHWGDQA